MPKELKYLLIALLLFSISILPAQITNKYAFVPCSTVWEIVGGNYVTEAQTDEGISDLLPIGFTFPYCGSNYTQVKLSSNGWLNLGGNLNTPYYGNDLATLNIRPLITALWDDLDPSYGAVMYNTLGDAPHRVFVASWLAVKWNYNGTNEFNFAVRLHETGQVDLIYGPHIGTPYNPSASIGMNMVPGGPSYYYSILPGNPPAAFSTNQYQNIGTVIPTGTLYLFMPKTVFSADLAALNVTGSKTPMQSVNSDYLVTVGNAGTTNVPPLRATVYLLANEEIADSVLVPQLGPSSYVSLTLHWTPQTVGLKKLKAKVQYFADTDSLNDVSYPFEVDVQPYVGNEDETAAAPEVQLSANPNPFSSSVTFNFNLKKPDTVKLEIYNLLGQKVTVLTKEAKSAGVQSLTWNGKDAKGKDVPNGIYFCRLQTNGHSVTKRIVRLK
ncbi:MAG TPA: T9SS type A sorting domain-containing protein [Candidatus Cloacimonadota bacterium]|nr:T9SS type A sorting domain-containing protein [Candidatus Cloacimonadota bacterium]